MSIKFGSLNKGWILGIKFFNPDVIKYKNLGRLKSLKIFGVVYIYWIGRRKNEDSC